MINDKDSAPTSQGLHPLVVQAIATLAHHIASGPQQGNDPSIVASTPDANDPGSIMNKFNLPSPTEHQDALHAFLTRFFAEQAQGALGHAHDGMRQPTPTPPVFDYARYLQGLA